jgi:hypothetical protein
LDIDVSAEYSSYFFPTLSRFVLKNFRNSVDGNVRYDRSMLPLVVVETVAGLPNESVVSRDVLAYCQPIFHSRASFAPVQSGLSSG